MMTRALVLIVSLLAGCASDSALKKKAPTIPNGCASGDLGACYESAQSLESGDADDRRVALVAFQYGCLLDHAPSCSGLARLYGQVETDVSNQRVRRALESACAGGEAESCVKLGDVSRRSRARDLYAQACESGSGIGCHKLARIVRRSWMLERNMREAVDLEEKACELGATEGCVAAGQAYLFGSGVTQNAKRAFELLDPTCTDDVFEGCEILAKMYEDGIGVKPDQSKASEYYDKAAEKDAGRVADSPASAYVVFVDACNHGNELGCFDAGWFRAEGVEVERNITTSRLFFERACDAGIEAACGRWEKIPPGGGDPSPSRQSAESAAREAE